MLAANCLMSIYRKLVKRMFDVTVAASALVLLTPLMVALAIAVRWKLGRPALFRQQRPGYAGKTFQLLKFRSMTDTRAADGTLLPDDLRLTPFGQWLRSTSLDELPELWNVIRGEMSLVGPRPLLVEYLDRYTPEQARRHEVQPGLTGLAQISGRNAISWDERFRLDVQYVDELSLANDFRILWKTVACVFCRTGINAPFHATMPPFGCAARESGPCSVNA